MTLSPPLSQGQQKENGTNNFADSLRDIQGEYMMLGELYEKQKGYGQRLTDIMKTMQFEVDTVIPIRPEAVGRPASAAYLASEGVVVVFDLNGGMTSKPHHTIPSDVIISVIQECTPELQRLLSEKRRIESNRVKSMERVLKELKKAQATFKQTKREDGTMEEEEEEGEIPPVEPKSQREPSEPAVAATPPRPVRDSFAFNGRFGEKADIATVTP